MRGVFFTLLITIFCGLANSYGQQTKMDSMIYMLDTQELSEAEQAKLCGEICVECLYTNPSLIYEYSERGLKLAEKAKNKKTSSIIYESVGRVLTYEGKCEQALEQFTMAMNLAKEIQDEEREACIYISFGVLARTQSKYDEALDYYTKALSTYEKLDDKLNVITILCNMGSIHRSLYNLDRALQYVQRAVTLSEEENDALGLMSSYNELGSIYYLQKEFEKEEQCHLKVLELCRQTGNKPYEATTLQAMSFRAMDSKNFEKALLYAQECLHIARELDNKVLLIGAWTGLSQIYSGTERHKESLEAAINAWELDSTDIHHVPQLLYAIINSNIMLGDKAEATKFLNKYDELYKQVNASGLHQAMLDAEVKYETEKKEIRINALEKEKILYICLGIAGFFVLLLALGLLLFRHRLSLQKRKLAEQQVKQLEQEKQLIATQAVLDGETAERSRLARDLHDGLGGMLSVVKLNLKDMKAYSIMDASDVDRFGKAVDMLDQSIGELRRVAHHIMPDSLMRYGLKVSLEDFCRAIPGAHFHYLGGDPRLDSHLEVLIYRCAYELVNNAVKHSQAKDINVQLMIDKGIISLTVQDNGVGFDPLLVNEGTGLENIRIRISPYNGRFNIYSVPDKGTEISIEIELL